MTHKNHGTNHPDCIYRSTCFNPLNNYKPTKRGKRQAQAHSHKRQRSGDEHTEHTVTVKAACLKVF